MFALGLAAGEPAAAPRGKSERAARGDGQPLTAALASLAATATAPSLGLAVARLARPSRPNKNELMADEYMPGPSPVLAVVVVALASPASSRRPRPLATSSTHALPVEARPPA